MGLDGSQWRLWCQQCQHSRKLPLNPPAHHSSWCVSVSSFVVKSKSCTRVLKMYFFSPGDLSYNVKQTNKKKNRKHTPRSVWPRICFWFYVPRFWARHLTLDTSTISHMKNSWKTKNNAYLQSHHPGLHLGTISLVEGSPNENCLHDLFLSHCSGKQAGKPTNERTWTWLQAGYLNIIKFGVTASLDICWNTWEQTPLGKQHWVWSLSFLTITRSRKEAVKLWGSPVSLVVGT